MTQMHSIFDNLVKGENDLTQLLRNMLRYKLFRRLFLELLDLGLETNDWEEDYFDVQSYTALNGRPDLILDSSNSLIFYEIKVYDTSLTPNQPVGYYNELVQRDSNLRKYLILLAPRNYYAFGEYEQRLSSIIPDGNNIITKTIYWEDVADLISKNELGATSPIFDEFYKFLDRWFKLKITLTNEDMNIIFNTQFPASLNKLTDLIDGIKSDFEKLGYHVKFQGSTYWEEYGYYFTTANDETIFFGIWFDYWAKYGAPLCITMEEPALESSNKFGRAIKSAGLKDIVDLEKCPTSHFDSSILEMPDSRKKIVEMIKIVVDEFEVVKAVKVQ